MDRLFVTGGARLAGSVRISGAKNSALKLMAASLLAPGRSVLRNVPRIQDCFTMGEVLEQLGARISWEDGGVAVDATHLSSVEAPYELVRRMRASIAVLGPLLARTGEARGAMPGGDNIGSRPIDLHLDGLRRMGARIDAEHGFLVATADRLSAASITLD
ncbi:MAG TPA: UDP-N-acetylglucosamine 1-carboxyvinyltransferase, partial [Actinomycetota bacterium]